MRHAKFKIAWGYLVEPILAGLLIVFGCTTIGTNTIAELVHQFAIDLATLYCTVFFAAALAFLWTFYSKADTDFYTWLDEIDAFKIFLHATGYVIAIEAFSIFLLLLTKVYDNQLLAITAAFAFLMALINSYTLVANVIELMKLHTQFNRVSRHSDFTRH